MWKTLSIFAALLLAGSGAVSYLKQGAITQARADFQQAEANEESVGAKLKAAEMSRDTKTKELADQKAGNESDADALVELDSQIETLKEDLIIKSEEKADKVSELNDLNEKIAIIGEIEELETKMSMLQAEKRAADDKVANLKAQLSGVLAQKDS